MDLQKKDCFAFQLYLSQQEPFNYLLSYEDHQNENVPQHPKHSKDATTRTIIHNFSQPYLAT